MQKFQKSLVLITLATLLLIFGGSNPSGRNSPGGFIEQTAMPYTYDTCGNTYTNTISYTNAITISSITTITTTKNNNNNISVVQKHKVKKQQNSKKQKRNKVRKCKFKQWSKHEGYLLAKIAMAEAECEPLKTKALVILTVLNRTLDGEFPDTIHGVIFQDRQFSPIDDGRWDRVEPDKECYKAVRMVANGYNTSQGCLYFEDCSSRDNWHSRNLQYLFEVGNMRFYK